MDDIQSQSARFIQTPDGDLIAPSHVASVKYWPGKDATEAFPATDHRVILRTTEGGYWDLYRGQSKDEAIAVRDGMIGKLRGKNG